MKRVGVCLFDDPALASKGWSAIAGGEERRVESAGDLQSDVLWVTNIDYLAYRKLNLNKAPHIFDQQYFRTSVKLLLAELGLSEDPKKGAITLSEIFTRIGTEAKKHFGVSLDIPGYRFSNLIGGATAPAFLRERVRGRFAADIQTGINQSYQANQAMFDRRPPAGSTAHVFTFPREAYARWLLSLPYPSGREWKEVYHSSNEATIGYEDGRQIAGTKALIAKLKRRSETEAIFFRVNVLSIAPEFKEFSTFGAGNQSPRRWASLPEIIEMSRYSKFSLMAGYKTPLEQLNVVPDEMLKDSPFSYSRGLLLENLWCGLAGNIGGSRENTAVGAYMRAYDRVVCNRMAELISKFNFVVGSYGTGRVMVYVPENERRAITEFAVSHRLLPSLQMTMGVSLND